MAKTLCLCEHHVSYPLTIWGELVLLKHRDTQDVLVQVFDEELAVKVPLWVQSVADGSGGVALSPHRQLAVRITLTWREINNLCSVVNSE